MPARVPLSGGSSVPSRTSGWGTLVPRGWSKDLVGSVGLLDAVCSRGLVCRPGSSRDVPRETRRLYRACNRWLSASERVHHRSTESRSASGLRKCARSPRASPMRDYSLCASNSIQAGPRLSMAGGPQWNAGTSRSRRCEYRQESTPSSSVFRDKGLVGGAWISLVSVVCLGVWIWRAANPRRDRRGYPSSPACKGGVHPA